MANGCSLPCGDPVTCISPAYSYASCQLIQNLRQGMKGTVAPEQSWPCFSAPLLPWPAWGWLGLLGLDWAPRALGWENLQRRGEVVTIGKGWQKVDPHQTAPRQLPSLRYPTNVCGVILQRKSLIRACSATSAVGSWGGGTRKPRVRFYVYLQHLLAHIPNRWVRGLSEYRIQQTAHADKHHIVLYTVIGVKPPERPTPVLPWSGRAVERSSAIGQLAAHAAQR